MSIRTDLLDQITTNIASYTNFRVSSELPFDTAGQPLYEKNMKTVYLEEENQEVTEHVPLLTGEIMQTETTVVGYLVVDAKNKPSDIDTVINQILAARTAIGSTVDSNASVETEIEDDKITYSFEYNFIKL
jgi:predicted nucleotidyltransferase